MRLEMIWLLVELVIMFFFSRLISDLPTCRLSSCVTGYDLLS